MQNEEDMCSDDSQGLNSKTVQHIERRGLKMHGRQSHRKRVERFLISELSYDDQDKWSRLCDDFVLEFFYAEDPLASVELDEMIARLWRKIFCPEDETLSPSTLQIRAVTHSTEGLIV